MKHISISAADLSVSSLAYGCLHLGGRWDRSPLTAEDRRLAMAAVETALEAGITLFDHADIYCFGKSEEAFSELWREHPSRRSELILQSKCGIRFADDPLSGAPKRYDFSCAHLIGSAEGILRRLCTDYLDILLLHRPDPLAEGEEVARAFSELHRAGKVRWFGVSNFTPSQIEQLARWVNQPIVVGQYELSLTHPHLITDGLQANRTEEPHACGEGLLEYCRMKDIRLQAWSPLAGGRLFSASRSEQDARIAQVAERLAQQRGVAPEAILLAWIMRHPAGIQPVIGTRNPERIRSCAQADEVQLTREEWYELLTASRGMRVP